MFDESLHVDSPYWIRQQVACQRSIRSRQGEKPTHADLWELFGQLRCEGTYGPISNGHEGRGAERPFEVVVADATGKLTIEKRIYRLPGLAMPALQIGRNLYGPTAVAILDSVYLEAAATNALRGDLEVDHAAVITLVHGVVEKRLKRTPRDRKTLNLSGCGIDDGDLADLDSFIQLEKLDVSRNQIRGSTFDRLIALEKLKSLELHTNPLAWEHVPVLANVLSKHRTVGRLTLPGQFRDRVDAVRELFPWLEWSVPDSRVAHEKPSWRCNRYSNRQSLSTAGWHGFASLFSVRTLSESFQ